MTARRGDWLAAAMALAVAFAAGAGDPFERVRSLVAEFGPPVVLVEAERPEHPDDRRAAVLVAEALASRGIRCADGVQSRTRRRDLADSAVAQGAPTALAREAIDRPDADFVVRIGSLLKDCGLSRSYGIDISARECTIAVAMVRFADQAAIEVGAIAATARSRSAAAAARDAERDASMDAAARIAEAAIRDWEFLLSGSRPWVVEVVSPSAGDAERLAETAQGAAVMVLENRPGVRALLQVSSGVGAPPVIGWLPGTEVMRRPGFVVMVAPQAADRSGTSFGWAAPVAAASIGLCIALAILRNRGIRWASVGTRGR